MKRGEGPAELKLRKDFVGKKDGLEEVGTAVDHAVTHRFDLAHVGDDRRFGIRQYFDDLLHRHGMIGKGDLFDGFLSVLALSVLDLAVDADPLANTFREDGRGGRVEELILQ